MNRTDPLDVLTALRPRPSEPVADHLRRRVLDTPPQAPAVRRPRRRYVAALAGALVLSGGGAAVAGGVVPEAFTDAFAGWTSDTWQDNGVTGADPATAERVASQPGPDGTVFSVLAAPTRAADDPDGPVVGACTVAVLETRASAAGTGPSDFEDVSGNGCQPSLRGERFATLGGVDVVRAAWTRLPGRDLWVWSFAAGNAVTAEVVTADGRRWPALVHDGTLYGWIPAPADGDAPPELVGHAADGSEVGRAPL